VLDCAKAGKGKIKNLSSSHAGEKKNETVTLFLYFILFYFFILASLRIKWCEREGVVVVSFFSFLGVCHFSFLSKT